MSKHFKLILLSILVLSASFFSGCGGGGVSDPIGVEGLKQNPLPPAQLLRGTVIKGAVSGAEVKAYAIVDGNLGSVIASGLTSADGSYSLSIGNYSGSVLVEALGGNYSDEASGFNRTLGQKMQAVIPSVQASSPVVVSPLTHVATAIASKKSTLSETSIRESLAQVSAFYSIPNILVTTPFQPTSSESPQEYSSDQISYGMLLSGISQLGQSNNTDPLSVMDVLARDASDGNFDGLESGLPLKINDLEITADLATDGLAQAIVVFSESEKNSSSAVVNEDFIFNLQSSSGDVQNPPVKLSLKAVPVVTRGADFTLKGNVLPGGVNIGVYRDRIKVLDYIAPLDGELNIPVPLISNQLNSFSIRAELGFSLSEKNVLIFEDSKAPELILSSSLPEYINTNSFTLSYVLTDIPGAAMNLSGSISQGKLEITSNKLKFTELSEGYHLAQFDFSDSLGNSDNLNLSFFVDLTNPLLETEIPAYASKDLSLDLKFSENISSVSFQFYPSSSSSTTYQTLASDTTLNLFFNDVQGTHLLNLIASDLSGNFTQISTSITFDSLPPYFILTPTFASYSSTNIVSMTYDFDSGVSTVLEMISPTEEIYSSNLTPSTTSFNLNNIQGLWRLSFYLEDNALNSSTYTTQFILDTVSPSVPVVIPSTLATSAAFIDISVSGEEGSKLFINGVSQFPLPSLTTLALVSNTLNPFTFILEDAAGNQSSQLYFEVLQDSIPPQCSLSVFSSSATTLVATDELKFEINCNQIEVGASAQMQFLSTTHTLLSTDQQNFSTTVSLAGLNLETRNPPFEIHVRDSFNNSDSKSGVVTTDIDTLSPRVTSYNFSSTSSSTYLGLGSTLTFDFELEKPEQNIALRYGSLSIGTSTTDGKIFSASYTPRVTHAQSDPNFLALSLSVTDAAGNNLSTGSISSFISDTQPPMISILTNDQKSSGFLKIGDEIKFSLVMESAESNLVVSARYNSQPVSFVAQPGDILYEGVYKLDESPTHNEFLGIIEQLKVDSITDRAGNTAVISSISSPISSFNTNGRMFGVGKKWDNTPPAITSIKTNYSVSGPLIIGSVAEFILSFDSSKEVTMTTYASVPLQAFGSFNSESLSFVLSSDGQSFIGTYVVNSDSSNSAEALTANFWLADGAGNLSTNSSVILTQGIDSEFILPAVVSGSVTSPLDRLTVGDNVDLLIGFNKDPELIRIESSAFGVPLTFYSNASVFQWTTTLTIPDTLLVTNLIKLENTKLFESSGNVSDPSTYAIEQLQTNQSPFVTAVNIDTLRPLISSITHNATTVTLLGIGDSVQFSVIPTYGAIHNLTSGPSVDLSSLTLNIQYNGNNLHSKYEATSNSYIATYTVLDSDPSQSSSLTLTGVYFVDGQGRVGPTSSLININFMVDTSLPQIQSVTAIASTSGATLIIGDQLYFTVYPSNSSTDAVGLTAAFNSVPVTFVTTDAGASFIGTYTVVTSQIDRVDPNNLPSLTGLQLRDAAGNYGPITETTDFGLFIDANLPDFGSITFDPSATAGLPTTIGIGAQIIWELPFISDFEDDLSVTARFLQTTFVMSPDSGANVYRGSYVVSDSLGQFSTGAQLIVTVEDSVGNIKTVETTNMGIYIDAQRPLLDSVMISVVNTAISTYVGIGQSILVSVRVSDSSTFGGIDPIQSVNGVVNKRSLSFSPADTDGQVWSAYYQVIEDDDPSNGGSILVTDVYATDLAGNSSGFGLTTSSSIYIFDATKPAFASITWSNNVATDRLKVDDSISFSLNPNPSTTDIVSVIGSFNSSPISFLSTSMGGIWRATYQITEGHSDQTDPNDFAQLSIIATDRASNQLSLTTTGMNYLFDSNTPQIASLSHDATTAGTLGIYSSYNLTNASIVFTLMVTPPELGLSVIASYNETSGGSIPLLFNPDATGSTYLATYTVLDTHLSTSTPYQLALTLSDSFGNAVTTATTNVAKSIDTSRPILVSLFSTPMITANTIPDSGDYLKIGDKLEFQAVFNSASSTVNLVTAVFNSQLLNFSSTDSEHWITTYTVVEGHPSPLTTIQLTNLQAFSQYNVSASTSSSSVVRIVDATRPVVMSLVVTSSSPVSYLSSGDFLNFQLVMELQSSSVDSGGTVSATYNGVELAWLEDPVQSGIYVSTYSALTTHADSGVALQLSNVLFYDSAGNLATTPAATIQAMQGVTMGIDVNAPVAPSVTPQFLATQSSNYDLNIAGEVGTNLYVNDSYHSQIPVGGTTAYTASLTDGLVHTFAFHLKDIANNISETTTAQIFASSFARQKLLTSSFSGLKTTNIGIRFIKESLHDIDKFFVYSRAGFGEISFSSETYTDRNNGLDNAQIHAVAEHPQRPSSNILLLTQDNALYRSTDFAANWSKVATPTFSNRVTNDVHFSEVAPSNVWVATDQNIFKSLDTGLTFSDFNPSGPFPSTADNRNVRSLFFETDNSRLYAGMKGGLFYANSSGSSWSVMLTDEPDILKISQPIGQSETMFLISTTNFLRTTDLSTVPPTTWLTITPSELSLGDINDIAFGGVEGVIYAAGNGGIFESSDNGSTWSTPQATGSGFPDINYTAVSAVSGNSNRILIGSATSMHKILDVNKSPYTQNDLTSIFPPRISYSSSDPDNLTTAWVATEMWLYRYAVAGNTWSLISTATPVSTYTFVEPYPHDSYLFVGSQTQGITTVSFDGVSTSLSLPIGDISTYVTSIAFHPTNIGEILVGADSYGIFMSNDGGATFSISVNGVGAVTITGLAGDQSHVYAATTTGIAVAPGADWNNLIYSDSANCSVSSASQLSIVSDQNGFYFIAGGDLYNAPNGCSSPMTNLTTDKISDQVLTSLVITSEKVSDRLIYVGTNQGLYRSRDSGSNFERVDDTARLNTNSVTLIEDTTETIKLLIGTDAGAYVISDIKID